jgi:hypothetical protein
VKTHAGSYGMGAEYAITMIRGEPASVYPRYIVPGT